MIWSRTSRTPATIVSWVLKTALAVAIANSASAAPGVYHPTRSMLIGSRNGTRFWYREDLCGGASEYILVDAEKGTHAPAFNYAKAVAALREASASKGTDRVMIQSIDLESEPGAVILSALGKSWRLDPQTYRHHPTPRRRNANRRSPRPRAPASQP